MLGISKPDALNHYRRAIGAIDAEILTTVAQRMRLAERIADAKHARGLTIHQSAVEAEVQTRNAEIARKLGIDPQFAAELTTLLLTYSRQVQEDAMTKPHD